MDDSERVDGAPQPRSRAAARSPWYQRHMGVLITAVTAIVVAIITVLGNRPPPVVNPMPTTSPPPIAVKVVDKAAAQCHEFDARRQILRIAVQPQATASSLSRLFGIPPDRIMKSCGSDGILRAGPVCAVPAPGMRVIVHQVQPGETVYSLGNHYGLAREEAILDWNCIVELQSGRPVNIFIAP